MRRVAAAATLLVPVGLSIAIFLATWLSETVSGAGLSEGNRPIAAFMLSAFGAAGWLMATAAIYVIHRPPGSLPRAARLFGLLLMSRPSSLRLEDAEWQSTATGLSPLRATATVPQLIAAAVLTLPLLTFIPPMLLGWLAQGDVWRPAEAVAVSAMAVIVVAWSTFLVARARQPERPRPTT